jgi:serine phosphatase RsbU (regulator of sigma subunit)
LVLKAEKNNIEALLRQKKELEQSIKYASYIQKALLPSVADIQSSLPKSFIYYLPRDVVSGDFYWLYKQKDKTIIAVGDSTGHGVPGAMLSVLGISFLNLVISKHRPETPAEILNFLREYIMKSLNQTGRPSEQKDGIDLSIAVINSDFTQLTYAGSFNPLYRVRHNQLEQLPGSKMPVGVDAELEKSFSNHSIELRENDMVYMFTDGFPDQFGGQNGKKFKYPAFRKLLINCSTLNPDEQHDILKAAFNEWKGPHAQLDDITVLGFRI